MKTILNTNYVKYLFLFTAILLTSSTIAQEEEAEEKKISISGSVDAYYQTNLSASDQVAQSFGTAHRADYDITGNCKSAGTMAIIALV